MHVKERDIGCCHFLKWQHCRVRRDITSITRNQEARVRRRRLLMPMDDAKNQPFRFHIHEDGIVVCRACRGEDSFDEQVQGVRASEIENILGIAHQLFTGLEFELVGCCRS